jgi:predicted GNAT family acetyltransferase
MSTEVIHNTDQNRYEIWLDGEKVGHADYSRMPGALHLVHTEVDPAHQGKQLAGILMQGLVDDVRATGRDKIVPVCSYTVMWMQRHPETHDLLLNPI